MNLEGIDKKAQDHALWLSSISFTICFAVWTIFAVIGVQIKKDLGLSEAEFGLLVGTPILTGSLIRLILGIWADQYGGRVVLVITMLTAAVATWLLTFAFNFPTFLLAALGVGIAGGSFAVGTAYVAKWFPKEKLGLALGIFGAGNMGAAVTKALAPAVMVSWGWQMVAIVWAIALVVMTAIFWFGTSDDPDQKSRKTLGTKPEPLSALLQPLKNPQVWRFTLYYFFVFGGYVALALWLPHYYMGVYGLDIVTAGLLAAAYSIPGSLFRILGGYLSDKWGARRVMYLTFLGSLTALFVLSYPATTYIVEGVRGPITFSFALGFYPFTVATFVLGFFMSLGKAAVYKHIPAYYPDRVGPVGGIVGLIGGLGGFLLPIAFGGLNDTMGVWTSCFMLLFGIAGVSLLWMHFSIVKSEKTKHPEAFTETDLPDLGDSNPSLTPKKEKSAKVKGSKFIVGAD